MKALNVYDTLRDSIINLTYKPGQEIDINSICEELEVSRSPVRDALLRLEGDKLIDIFPQKGTRVSLLNKEIIKQERFMRINLELGMIEPCMNTLTAPSKREIFVTKMNGILLAQKASILENDKISFLKHDDEMHHLFYVQAGCEWIWETQISHSGNDHRIRMLSYYESDISELVQNEHKKLISAIEANDIQKIIEIDKEHLTRLYDEIERFEASYPEFFVTQN